MRRIGHNADDQELRTDLREFRVVWCSPSYGYNGNLLYFEPIFAALSRRIPGMLVPVDRRFPVERYPDLPLIPILRLRRVVLPTIRGTARTVELPTASTLLRIVRLRPQVLIGIEFTPLSVLAMLVIRLLPGRRRILLFVESDPVFRGSRTSRRTLRAKRILCGLADIVVANNELAEQYLVGQVGLATRRVRRLPYLTSDPLGLRPEDSTDSGRLSSERRILFVNSLTERKGASLLLRAFALMPQQAQNRASLHLVGDGPDLQELRELVGQLSLQDVTTFHGRHAYSDLWQDYASADIVVAPSLRDYRSLGAIEAAASGKPAIVSRHDGAYPELALAGAAIVDPLDLDGFSAELARLVLDDDEYARRLRLAQTARSRYSVESVVTSLARLIMTNLMYLRRDASKTGEPELKPQ